MYCMKKITTLVVTCALLFSPGLTMANSFEQALQQVQIDLLQAYYIGDEQLVSELFSVMFELLTIQQLNPTDSSGGSDQSSSSSSHDDDIDVETRSATDIEGDEATLRARVDWDDADRGYAWFEYGEDDDDLDERTNKKNIDDDDDDYSITIDDLDEDEKYYFQAVVEDRDTGERYYGDIEDFRADEDGGSSNSGDGDVKTLSADDVTEDSAVLRGEVTEGDDIESWFAFSKNDSTPSCSANSQREDPDGDDEYDEDEIFELEIDDLDEDEKYYFRACIEDEDNDVVSGSIKSFTTDEDDDEEQPDVDTKDADDVTDEEAELNGTVDMNDFRNGLVFYVWGEDEGQIEDVEDEDQYKDVDEDGDDLQKQKMDSDLDDKSNYVLDLEGLDDDTRYYYTLCVEYEDEDDDETILCGSVEDFRTDD